MPTRLEPASARGVALAVLDAALAERPQAAEAAFADAPGLDRLSTRDRAFARSLYTNTLRRLGEIDALLRTRLQRRPALRVMNLLRLGVTQLHVLRTPPHAAVAETVTLAPAHARGLVNAVLRRLADAPFEDAPERNAPAWLRARWTAAYGGAGFAAIAAAHAIEPPLDLTVKADPDAWAARLNAVRLPNGTLRLARAGMIEDLPSYAEGAWWVQDVAASLPAALLGPVAGMPVLDLCAAPGGKTAQLAAAGARVTAVEAAPERAETLRRNLDRLRLDAEIIIADARGDGPAFGHILLDAPCTATGTVRRHPDILWSKRPENLAHLVRHQRDLLDAAIARLAPGGALVYAVCSLEPEEGPEQIEAALNRHPGLARREIAAEELGGLPLRPTVEGDLRTLPSDLGDQGGMDGFFIGRLTRPA